ncbi:hypothetical protein [Ferrovibrio sp.]|uniref:hypothetical protein n=1 Tax=Ferrovibrio sp. TaxID=1917215 RepID=UPI003D12184C
MIEIKPFTPADLQLLDLQPEQGQLAAYFQDPAYGAELARHADRWGAMTLWLDGTPRACAGLLPKWQGVLTAWAAITPAIPPRAWACIAAVMEGRLQRALADPAWWRVETHVLDGWPPGHVLMRHLRFVPEGLHPCWGPDGRDYWVYGRLCPPAPKQEIV